ncbi:TolC family protein [Sphingomicrobium sp. XHP0239]|uniref:TolC family protein n=1 Tax=Sphingomicrobium maritimum TaxID=3133972 RepID=UPI0031CCA87D
MPIAAVRSGAAPNRILRPFLARTGLAVLLAGVAASAFAQQVPDQPVPPPPPLTQPTPAPTPPVTTRPVPDGTVSDRPLLDRPSSLDDPAGTLATDGEAAIDVTAQDPLAADVAAGQPSVYGPIDTRTDVAPLEVVPSDAPGVPVRLQDGAISALSSFPALRSARANIRAADLEVDAAKWLYGPSVTVGALTRGVGGVSPELTVTQPIYSFGRIEGTIERAKAVRNFEATTLGELAENVLLRLAENYYEIVRTSQVMDALEVSIAEHQRLVESIGRRVDRAVSPRSDLELADARLAQVRQQYALVTAQRYAAQERYRELTGQPSVPTPPFDPYNPQVHHPSPEDAIQRAVACSPTIDRLGAEAEIAEADRRIAGAAIYPQLGVQYRYDEFRGSQLGLSVQASSQAGLQPFIAADAARARVDAALLEVNVAERQVREALILDLVENQSSRGRITSSAAASTASEAVTDSYLRQFVAGRRTWLDVMNAVREASNARIGLVESEVSAMSSAARIRIRTCEWRPYPALQEVQE